jgi:hypothetical protein
MTSCDHEGPRASSDQLTAPPLPLPSLSQVEDVGRGQNRE